MFDLINERRPDPDAPWFVRHRLIAAGFILLFLGVNAYILIFSSHNHVLWAIWVMSFVLSMGLNALSVPGDEPGTNASWWIRDRKRKIAAMIYLAGGVAIVVFIVLFRAR